MVREKISLKERELRKLVREYESVAEAAKKAAKLEEGIKDLVRELGVTETLISHTMILTCEVAGKASIDSKRLQEDLPAVYASYLKTTKGYTRVTLKTLDK